MSTRYTNISEVVINMVFGLTVNCVRFLELRIVTLQGNCSLTEHQLMGPKLTAAEGMILGTAAKMFTIAGPVIVYGVSASVVYGLIYWIMQMMKGG